MESRHELSHQFAAWKSPSKSIKCLERLDWLASYSLLTLEACSTKRAAGFFIVQSGWSKVYQYRNYEILRSVISVGWYQTLKPSLSRQWSHIRSFIRGFISISFVWLCSQKEGSHTKLMQNTKPWTRFHWLERLGINGDIRYVKRKILGCCLTKVVNLRGYHGFCPNLWTKSLSTNFIASNFGLWQTQ